MATLGDPVEADVAAVWGDVLGRERISRDDNFFDLGGDSVSALVVLAALRDRGFTVELKQLFKHQTVVELAAALPTNRAVEEPIPVPFELVAAADREALPSGLDDAYPLSSAQAGSLYHSMVEPTAALYRDVLTLRMRAPFDADTLRAALDDVVRRHPVLRTSFDLGTYSEPLQLVHTHAAVPFETADLRALSDAAQRERLDSWVAAYRSQVFQCGTPPLCAFLVCRITEDTFVIAFGFHHAIVDGWSNTKLVGQWLGAYRRRLRGTAETEPPRAHGAFREFVALERAATRNPVHRDFWRRVTTALTALTLSAGDGDPAGPVGGVRTEVLDRDLVARVRAVTAAEGMSLKHACVAAHLWVIGQLTGHCAVYTVGSTNGRPPRSGVDNEIGLFVNGIVYRATLTGGSWLDLLRTVFDADCELLPHRHYPYAEILRTAGDVPFETGVNYVRYPAYDELARTEDVHLLAAELYEETELPFGGHFLDDPATGELTVRVQYDARRFGSAWIDRVHRLYADAFAAIAADPAAVCPQPTGLRTAVAARIGVGPDDVSRIAPVTPVQRDFYLDQARRPDTGAFLPAFSHDLGPDADPQRWRHAVRLVADADEILRSRAVLVDGVPHLCVVSGRPAGCTEIDVNTGPPGYGLLEAVAEHAQKPFGDEGEPLVRQFLVRDADRHLHAVFGTHHMVVDGPSHALLFQRLLRAYHALSAGEEPHLAGSGRFLDRVPDITARFDTPETLAYWRTALATAVSPTLPRIDDPSAPARFHPSARIAGTALDRLTSWCAERGLRRPSFLLAMYAAFVGRHAVPDGDFLVYSVANGREESDADTIGCYLHVVPTLAPSVLGVASAEDYARRFAARRRESRAHQNISVLHQRRLRAADQVRFLFNYMAAEMTAFGHGELRYTAYEDIPGDECHMTLHESPTHIDVLVQCSVELAFGDGFADRFVAFVDNCVSGAPMTAALPVSEVEERELLGAGFGPEEPVPARDLVTWLRSTGGEVICGDRRAPWTEVRRAADGWAQCLAAHGVRPGDTVAVTVPRSIELVGVLLGVLTAGAAFLPIDEATPAERVAGMLADAGCTVGVAGEESPPVNCCTWLSVNAVAGGEATSAGPAGRRSAAYVLFTSGSTGRPKGVRVGHDAIVNRLAWQRSVLGLTSADVVLHKTPAGFDVSVWELFAPLVSGAGLVVAEPGVHRDPWALVTLIRKHGITVAHFVPSMLDAFLAADGVAGCTSLRHVVCSGETLPPGLAERFGRVLPGARLHNMYGPTEAAVDVTWWTWDGRPAVPIGRPAPNVRLYVLDSAGVLAPPGVAGELYIGGVQVAQCYVGQPGLTADRFVPDPFGSGGARIYRTGDRCRWRSDRTLEYLGRTDRQVKVRGMRVEPGEIENVLTGHPEVDAAAVLFEDRLLAYVVGGATGPAVRRWLAGRLPAYMIPDSVTVVDRLPTTANGKLDRAALPAPAPRATAAAVAASTALETVILGVWRAVLADPAVGVTDNFFEVGGHSLLLLRVHGRLEHELGRTMPIVDLFTYPTVRSLAEHLSGGTPHGPAVRPERVGGRRSAVALRHRRGGRPRGERG